MNKYENILGSFNISKIDLSDQPGLVRLWTDAEVNSPFAQEWMNKLVKGQQGLGEITYVTVGDGRIVLELNSSVKTERKSKEVVRRFMALLAEAAEGLDSFDRLRLRYSHDSSQLRAAMATDSLVSTFDHADH